MSLLSQQIIVIVSSGYRWNDGALQAVQKPQTVTVSLELDLLSEPLRKKMTLAAEAHYKSIPLSKTLDTKTTCTTHYSNSAN